METALKATLRWGVFVLAVAATTAWVVLSFTYLNRLGWDGLLSLEPGALASTLAAVAAPPAALWLVLVVVAQQQELSLLRRAILDLSVALRRGQDHVEANGRTLLELAAASERREAQHGIFVALDDLASHAALIAERLGVIDSAGLDLAWARYGAGDRWALLRPFLDRAALEENFGDRLIQALGQDAPARLAADAFVRRAKALRGDESNAGEQILLRQILDDGPIAQVDRLFALVSSSATGGNGHTEPRLSQDGSQVLSNSEETEIMADRLGPQPTLFPAGSQTV